VGEEHRIGINKCYQCRKPFTVTVGTIFESSHVPMQHWLQAIFLVASSKKGISANQLHRTLGCTLKTAWFIGHRIREAMKLVGIAPIGDKGKVVELSDPQSVLSGVTVRVSNLSIAHIGCAAVPRTGLVVEVHRVAMNQATANCAAHCGLSCCIQK
jgi:hypothetical protein